MSGAALGFLATHSCCGLVGVPSLRLLSHLSNGDRAVMITMATTHSFIKYLWNSYYVPGTAADTSGLMETRQRRTLIYGVYSGGRKRTYKGRGKGSRGVTFGEEWDGQARLGGLPSALASSVLQVASFSKPP